MVTPPVDKMPGSAEGIAESGVYATNGLINQPNNTISGAELLRLGYGPALVLFDRGRKGPKGWNSTGWIKRVPSEAEVLRHQENVGLKNGELLFNLDLDFHVDLHGPAAIVYAQLITNLARQILGPPCTFRNRDDDAATSALWWKTAEPLSGIEVVSFRVPGAPTAEEAGIEFRMSGQTMVSGVHPSGGRVVPAVFSFHDAAPVTLETIRKFRSALDRYLQDGGYSDITWTGGFCTLAERAERDRQHREENQRRLETFLANGGVGRSERFRKYAFAALSGAANDLAQTPVSRRRTTLFAKAAHLAELCAGTGEPDEAAAREVLLAAAGAAGLTEEHDPESHFKRGWKKGSATRKVPKDRPRESEPPPRGNGTPLGPEPPPHADADAPGTTISKTRLATPGPTTPSLILPLRFVHRPFDEHLLIQAPESERLATYLYRGAQTMWVGEPGGTKSWAMLHDGLTAARGRKRVLYVPLEGHKKKLDHRIERLTAEDDWSQLREYLHISHLPGMDESEGGRLFKLTDAEWVEVLLGELRRPEWKADVLLIDPLADAMDGDPDKEMDVRPAKDALKRLRFLLNIAIGLGHHTVKRAWTDSTGNREEKPSKAHARGSGSWVGTADIMVDVTPTASQTPSYGEAVLTATKAKDYPDVPSEQVFTVKDAVTKDGRMAVITALHDRAAFQGSPEGNTRHRREAIAALRKAEGGHLTTDELLDALKLPGKQGRPILRALGSATGPLCCVTGADAKAVGFSPNAHVWSVKPCVSEE